MAIELLGVSGEEVSVLLGVGVTLTSGEVLHVGVEGADVLVAFGILPGLSWRLGVSGL